MTGERFPTGPLEYVARGGQPAHRNDREHGCPFCVTDGTVTLSATCVDVAAVGMALGVTSRTIHRWRHEGISAVKADELAVRLGMHPAQIWEQWCDIEWTPEPEEVEAA